MGGIKLFRAFISIFTLALSARYFGTTVNRDAWILATLTQTVLLQIFFGPVNEIFRAKYVHIKEEYGERYALQSCNSLLSLFSFIALSIIILCTIFPQVPARIFAPGFKSENVPMLILMIQTTIPLLLFHELVAICSAILNSNDSFLLPDIYSALSAILNILLVILFAPHIGIYTLVISAYLTTVPLLLILIKNLKKRGVILHLKIPVLAEYKPFIIFAIPFYLPYIIGQLTSGLEKALCSFLPEGSISVLDYSRKFIELPMSVYISMVFSILTPILSKYFIQKKYIEYRNEFASFLRMGLLIFAPIIILLAVCSRDIVTLLLARGKFDVSWVSTTAITIMIFGVSLFGVIFYVIAGQSLVTLKKEKLYAFFGAITQLLPLCLNLLFYKQFGIVFFAFSWGLSHLVFGTIMFILLPIDKKKINREIIKILFLYIITGFVAYLVHNISLAPILSISVNVVTSLIIMTLCLLLLNIEEKVVVYKIIAKLRGLKYAAH